MSQIKESLTQEYINTQSSTLNEDGGMRHDVEQRNIVTQNAMTEEILQGENLPNMSPSTHTRESEIADGIISATVNDVLTLTGAGATENHRSVSSTATEIDQRKSASTPKTPSKRYINEYFDKTPEKDGVLTQLIVPGPSSAITSTPMHTTTVSSPRSGPIANRGKRRYSVKRSSTKSKKHKKQLQVGSSNKKNGSSKINEDNSSSNFGRDASATDNDVLDEDEPSGTSQHFSIHKLSVKSLRTRFKSNLASEVELIDKVIQEINQTPTMEYKAQYKIRVGSMPHPNKEANGTAENVDLTFGYQVLVYVQKLEQYDDFLFKYKVYDNTVRLNKIVFYHRKDEIYALTIGPTWKATQVYSCYNFPCQISGRLTSTEGNTQEIAMHLTGNVRVSKSIKKCPTPFDQMKTVMLNGIKPLRNNCSLYGLTELRNTPGQQIKLQIGLAYVRIKKRIDLKNLPEILDHFTKICNGEETRSFPSGNVEIQANDFPHIRGVSGEEASEAENSLYELVRRFMHNKSEELI